MIAGGSFRRSLAVLFSLGTFLASPAMSQPAEMKQQLAAMELTLFEETFCKDKPIRRIERLEENFLDAAKQKEKDLPTRIKDLMERIKPTEEMLNKPDPCESEKSKKGFLEKVYGPKTEEKESNFESYNYPVINWKAVEIPEIPGSVAKLSTNFEGTKKGFGKLKYKLTIKVPQGAPRYLYVTLLDADGFKLGTFLVQGGYFKDAGIPDHFEANESQPFAEKDYHKARGYAVNLR